MKRKRIQQLKRENPEMSSPEIAEEVGSSASYVRQVWNDVDDDAPPASRRDRDRDPIDELGDDRGDELEDDPVEDALADLVIDDKYDSYECGECEAELEYLEPECPECGTEPAWWAIK